MYSTNLYLYPQKQLVLLLNRDNLYQIRWRPVYTKNLRVSKGVDNTILFQFMNQDQKPVDITGMVFTLRLISRDGTLLLLTKDLEIHNIERGQARLTLVERELDSIQTQLANYSITVSGTLIEPVFVDDNAGSRGVISIEDAVYPEFVESEKITLPPSIPAESNRIYGALEEHQTTLSSQWIPMDPFQTMQYTVSAFEGDIVIQALDVEDNSKWHNVETIEFNDIAGESGVFHHNIEGLFNKMRLKVDTIQGSLSDILIR